MNILQNNPYRLLGIYANASARDQLASIHRFEAYLKVGRQTALPLELPGLIPTTEKTVDSIKDAAAKLALPQSKLHYAQFWFLKIDQFDEIAFKHLLDGDIAKAMDIWSKHESVSSLQNRIVCSLIQNNVHDVVRYAEKLYGNAGYIAQFVSSVIGEGIGVTTDNLGTEFIDALADDVGPGKLLPMISLPTWQQHIKQKSVAPLLSSIQEAINKSKQSRGKGAEARLEAGNTLMCQTKPLLAKLHGLLAQTDLQYQSIADRLANEVLQCGIDYFNNSEDDDAPQKAMVLQKYALSIAAGPMAKDRCKENVKILQKIVDDMPPASVTAEAKKIREYLREFCEKPDEISYSITLLNNTKPLLQAIKRKLGSTNSFYLSLSTQVVGNALHNLIEEVNMVQNRFSALIEAIKKQGLDPALLNYLDDSNSPAKFIENQLKPVVRSAWRATQIMDTFDMQADFKTGRYTPNRQSLRDMCISLHITTTSTQTGTRTTTRTSTRTTPPQTTGTTTDDNPNNGWIAYWFVFAIFAAIGAIVNGDEGLFVGGLIGAVIFGPIAKAIASDK